LEKTNSCKGLDSLGEMQDAASHFENLLMFFIVFVMRSVFCVFFVMFDIQGDS
jgi:hypothetical protein